MIDLETLDNSLGKIEAAWGRWSRGDPEIQGCNQVVHAAWKDISFLVATVRGLQSELNLRRPQSGHVKWLCEKYDEHEAENASLRRALERHCLDECTCPECAEDRKALAGTV